MVCIALCPMTPRLEQSCQELAEMSLLRKSQGRYEGRTQAMEAGLTRSGVLGVCTGPGWGRTGRGKFPHLQGIKASKCGHTGSWRKAPGWEELETVVAGKHTSPLTSSLSRKQREGLQCSSSPPLCALSIPAQSVLRGGTVAKLRIFSGSQERRGKMGWEREEADSQAAGEGKGEGCRMW